MDLRSFVIEHVNFDDYYESRFPKQWDRRARNNVTCPFHDDRHPSLSVGLEGGGAKCWAASCTARPFGNIVHFEAARLEIDESDAASRLYAEFIRPVVPKEQIATLQTALAADTQFIKYLKEDCGLDRNAQQLFGLGLDRVKKRIAIPVYDRWGQCVNLRMYRLPRHRKSAKDEDTKVLNYARGYGALDLFPWVHFVKYELAKPLFIMPSEKECMLAISHGLQAIASTCGEDSWNDEWTDFLVGYDICVVSQNDEGGRIAAQKRLEKVRNVASSAIVVEIATLQKDFADWVVKENGSGLKLLGFYNKAMKGEVNSSPKFVPVVPTAHVKFPKVPPLYSDEIVEIAHVGSRIEMLNKVVKTQGIVAAKTTHTYSVPWRFEIRQKNNPAKRVDLDLGRELISFVNASDQYIREHFKAKYDDAKLSVQPLEFVTIVEVEIIPTATIDRDVPYAIQRCYFVGRWIDANVPYEFKLVPTTEIKTQKTVGIIFEATPISLSFETLSFSGEEFAALQIFQRTEEESVWDKLQSFAETLATHYTKIFNRPDWHIVSMLTWVSPIGWKFPGEQRIQRGWLNTLALGDTETGKSRVTQTIQEITKCGQFVSSENCTYVGLVGGAIKMGSGQLMLRWGRIPLCDKQLVVLEELSGLTVENISHMSDLRSSGIARLDKGGLSSETNARTRLLALSNVRSKDKMLSQMTSGVKAVQELVGHAEDIARFDLIITLIDSDVSLQTINSPAEKPSRKSRMFSPADLQRLVQFAWSLKNEQVRFTTEAYFACLEHTIELAQEYHPAAPLFKGGSGRYKLARIAAAIATLQFSWDDAKKQIVVNEEHVEATVQLLRELYNKHPLRYDEWSKQMFDREDVKDVEEIVAFFEQHIKDIHKRNKVLDAMVHAGKFSRDELCAIAGITIMYGDDLVGMMLRNRVIRKSDANTWELTPPGKRFLQKLETDETQPD